MKILHTSDWHIGRSLFGRKRYEEFEAFLAWLSQTIEKEQVDALIVAGDVFDSGMPSNRAQELYYRFLCRTAGSACRHVVVVGGNHDSPSFLDAPRELLRVLDVHVVGSAERDVAEEVLLLRDKQGAPEMVVCAVPYLRDRDIRTAEACESVEDKDRNLLEGIRSHYRAVFEHARRLRAQQPAPVPIVAVGHLFVAGGRTLDGDGVRELYVGSLAHVPCDIFPPGIDYVCLGHLHVPQKVNGSEVMRYCGSPLPIGFSEAKQEKSVCLVEFTSSGSSVRLIPVPVFRTLLRIQGSWEEIEEQIKRLPEGEKQAWAEVIYEGPEVIGDLRERLEACVSGTGLTVLRVKNSRIADRALGGEDGNDQETLDDLTDRDVFERCLEAHAVPEEQRPELRRTYQEAVASIHDDDPSAE